jgi:hypothetical protein
MDNEVLTLMVNGEFATEHGKYRPGRSLKPFLDKNGREDELYITFSFYNGGGVQIIDDQ